MKQAAALTCSSSVKRLHNRPVVYVCWGTLTHFNFINIYLLCCINLVKKDEPYVTVCFLICYSCTLLLM